MDNYAITMLNVHLYEWKGIKDRNNRSIALHGPSQYACQAIEEADKNIKELEEALKKLTDDR